MFIDGKSYSRSHRTNPNCAAALPEQRVCSIHCSVIRPTHTMTQMKKALITGITGQDGSYLTEFLLSKSYKVYGVIRRSSSFNTGRIDHIYQDPHDPDP